MTATGCMFLVNDRIVHENFTSLYISRLKKNANKWIEITIGRRTALSTLPSTFPLIPASCRTTQPGTERCCVGFGLAAAMHALGDCKWLEVRNEALAAVEAAESPNLVAGVSNEIDYFQRLFRKTKGSLYRQVTCTMNPSCDPLHHVSCLLPKQPAEA